jgi:16S rRNA G1207 methylase RsmC
MNDHYFSENPKSTFKREQFTDNVLGNDIIINSGSGIFSYKSIDFGTRLLIENAKIISSKSLDNSGNIAVLDLGCGYGIVGIALKKKYPDIKVIMTDINERAVRLAKENVILNNLDIEVYKSDIYSNIKLHSMKFDIILTNPPFSAGKDICRKFIRQGHDHLRQGGIFQIVAPHNKGGESLKKYMLEVFGNAGDIAKKSGYRVYISIKK